MRAEQPMSRSAISDRMLRDLSHPERAELLRRIQMLTASELQVSQRILAARRWSVRFLAVCCLVLIPWTAGLEPDAPIPPLWRTPLITFPGPPEDDPPKSRDPSPW